MKRLAELTAADLRQHPVWMYHSGPSDGDLGATVEAVERPSLSENEDGVFIAATRFVLADGSEWPGYCSPQDSSGLDYVQPVVVTEHGPNPMWFEQVLSPEEESRWWKRFGRGRDAVFPISWECLVPVDGAVVSGVINGTDVFRHGAT